MNSINHPNIYMRSLATRQQNLALSAHVKDAVDILKYANYDIILLESVVVEIALLQTAQELNLFCRIVHQVFQIRR